MEWCLLGMIVEGESIFAIGVHEIWNLRSPSKYTSKRSHAFQILDIAADTAVTQIVIFLCMACITYQPVLVLNWVKAYQ